jgi:hypothetical protein
LLIQEKGSALGASGDEQKEVFSLTTMTTTTTEKLPTVSKKRSAQHSMPSRQQKPVKKSTTYDRKQKRVID